MSVHSSQKKRRKDYYRAKFKTFGRHEDFVSRITKTLYCGDTPISNRLTLPVTEFAADLFSEVKAGRSLERLRLEEASEISRNTCASPCSFVMAMLYLDRLKACNPSYVDKVVPSELFLISMMVASKFLNDDGEEDEVLNSDWAESSGLSLKAINKLERQFLNAINWEVYIKESSFWASLRKLEKAVALKEGKRRGWFSYTELETLLDCLDSFTLAQALLMVSAVCLASYTAGVLTVVGSTILVSQIPTGLVVTQSASLMNSPIEMFSSFSILSEFLSNNVHSVNSCIVNDLPLLKKELIQNWHYDSTSWIGESDYTDDKNGSLRMNLKKIFETGEEMRVDSVSLVSSYMYLVTQRLQNIPLTIISDH